MLDKTKLFIENNIKLLDTDIKEFLRIAMRFLTYNEYLDLVNTLEEANIEARPHLATLLLEQIDLAINNFVSSNSKKQDLIDWIPTINRLIFREDEVHDFILENREYWKDKVIIKYPRQDMWGNYYNSSIEIKK